jgi:hypothetical protein
MTANHPEFRLSRNAKAAIRAVEILMFGVSGLIGWKFGLAISVAVTIVNELTHFVPLTRTIVILGGTITAAGSLRTSLRRNLGGLLVPAGEVKVKKIPGRLVRRGFIAETFVPRPGNTVQGRVVNSSHPITFAIEIDDDPEQKFDDAIEFAYELYGDKLHITRATSARL